jgi:spore coat polysaccharide biosynthesis protein SpsF
MNIVAIVQARLGSTRFPKKMFAKIEGKTLIEHVITRLEYSKEIDHIVLATTENAIDDELCVWAENHGIDFFRGSENNVLERYYFAALKFKADIIVRVTGDDPLKDVIVIDQVISILKSEDLDFSFNNFPPSFPEGMDCEVMTMECLKIAFENAVGDFEREHLTQYLYNNLGMFNHSNFSSDINYSNLRWTIDTKEDLEMVKCIYSHLYKNNPKFGWLDVIDLLKEFPEISNINNFVKRSHLYNN